MSKVFVEERGNNLIFYNEEEYMELDFIEAKIEDKYPDIDVEVNYGGQPIYYYIISVE